MTPRVVRTSELVGRAVGMLASVLDFDRCYIAGSVALGYGDEFFSIANDVARSMAPMDYSADLQVATVWTGQRWSDSRCGARGLARSVDVKCLLVAGTAAPIWHATPSARVCSLARAGWRFRADGWWRRAPHLPLPDDRYWHFRTTTYAGDLAQVRFRPKQYSQRGRLGAVVNRRAARTLWDGSYCSTPHLNRCNW
jgi:hypothetical protein